jgi:ABC-type transporter Mla MlaB component
MKARPKKPGARSTAAKKPAVARGRPVSEVSKRLAAKAAAARPGRPVSAASKVAKARSAPRSSKAAVATPAAPLVATLGADCTIEHAPGLHQELLKMLGERACVTLDVSAVKRCDTAGLQILIAFVRERREAGQPVELKGATEAFIGPATLIGLAAAFGFETQAAQA